MRLPGKRRLSNRSKECPTIPFLKQEIFADAPRAIAAKPRCGEPLPAFNPLNYGVPESWSFDGTTLYFSVT
jgi:hypothetical protein